MAPTSAPTNVAEKKQGKKKGKTDRPPSSPAQEITPATENGDGPANLANGTDTAGDSPYLKELNK